MRGVRGVDISTEAQLGKFRRIGESLADFKLLNNVSELGQEFQYIAKSLIDEWAVLNCFVPNSFKGRVAWTYPSKKQVVVEKLKLERPKGEVFFGLNAGVRTDFRNFTVGLDLAFPLRKGGDLGFYVSGGYASPGFIMTEVGILGLANFNNGGSLYIGGGVAPYFGTSYGYANDIGPDIRAGYKFKNGLYLFAESRFYFQYGFYTNSLLHIGYAFSH